jgi:thiol-disulfide isomerase/thioredoxin
MKSKLLIPIGLVLAGVLIAGAVIYSSYSGSCKLEQKNISADDAANKMISFINNTLLAGQQSQASLIGTTEENGTYKVSFNVEDQQVDWRISKDGLIIFPQIIDINEAEKEQQQQNETAILANFTKSSDDLCTENGKPIVYFFGSESCPHCQWEHPITEEVMAKFGDLISFHNNMDNNEDMDIFGKYSTGGIPTTVLGCEYYRVGSGESLGEEEEAKDLTALTCKLTGGQPGDVCSQVQDLIDQL